MQNMATVKYAVFAAIFLTIFMNFEKKIKLMVLKLFCENVKTLWNNLCSKNIDKIFNFKFVIKSMFFILNIRICL